MKANIPGVAEKIEVLMGSYRASIDKRHSVTKLEELKAEVFKKFQEVRNAFSAEKMSPGVAFGAAFSIFLREGFEAVLIVIVLISILRAMGQSEAVRWVHFGWIAAVASGLAIWFASGLLLAIGSVRRELMEGSISVLAVAVLIYVGFWLHRYSEVKKWHAYLEAKLRHGLTKGSFRVLALVSFLAVFRESFEVVLFLRAIWIDLDSSGQTIAK
jgi:high-affinity iron transporter